MQPEKPNSAVLEQEIAELNEMIAEKRKALESTENIISEQELVKEAVKERFSPAEADLQNSRERPIASLATTSSSSDYLDALDDETKVTVQNLVDRLPELGVRKVLEEAKLESFAVLDAFHDFLASRLYQELKDRRMI